jgi:pimeloyl-ACP methyl ester carboxylesterase
MQEKRVKANQIELQIRDYEREGEPIIFLHFSGANLMMWQPTVPFFRDRYRLILVDLRGHGKSDKPATGYHMDDIARDVVGIMEHLDLEPAHIVGSSLGAEVGLSIAANHPERVRSLVCDGALSSEYGPYGTWDGSEAEFEAHVTEQLEKMRNRPDKLFPSVDALVADRRELFEKYIGWNEHIEAMERYGAYEVEEGKFRGAFGKQALADYMEHYFHYRFEDYYRRVRCPLLMLTGEEDPDEQQEIAAMKGLCDLAEQGEIVAVREWEHPYGWLLDPEGVSQVILEFLGETAGQSE